MTYKAVCSSKKIKENEKAEEIRKDLACKTRIREKGAEGPKETADKEKSC
jgi:hypothetical protein